MPEESPVDESASKGAHPTVTDPTAETPGSVATLEDQPILTTGSGLHLPRLGLGTHELTGRPGQAAIEDALAVGYRHIDTAQMYGNEAEVGAAIRASGLSPFEVFITTKIDNDRHEPDEVQRSLDESAERLGSEVIDLVLIHWPVEWERISATIAALAVVHAGGRCRHIGVSNFSVDQLRRISDLAPIEVVQDQCHLHRPRAELRAWCRDNDVAFVAYSPLAKGAILDDPALSDVAAETGAAPSQVALAWLLHQPGVAVIPRSADPDHLRSNWEARWLELERSALERLARADA